ncbi:mandelate racemase/muconate lactonizing enzyme family protein [Sabulicella glaciei]|uniref:Mandelate racemase/muconate lactonizing enzyme family protein n=1 Tax=Sabulicella glaciei TaxID=2984948 RepID=A0ABT3P1B4_9PROT|nr:mandelate racemase/muconate lactonizing enzyme family protein [Roseococcus sp. MDT2-1-1]MCW8088198.1 mandelate racemase/muconate lactonizing enzyme family protein [Roseococcus sp. MDT2-1-1]
MRIRSISAEVRSLAKLGSAARGYAALDAPAFVLCHIEGEDGLVGQGVTGRFLATQVADLIAGAMAEALQGEDARRIEAIGPALTARFNPRGAGSVFTAALSAVDMALWDLRARTVGEPLWRLLGGARESVPCYATVGLPGYDETELATVCKQSVDEGYLGVKMLVAAGGRSVAEDAARVRAVRAAIGPDARLIIDANCGMNLGDAKRLALMVEDCDIAWFEEPLRDNDIEGLAAMRRAVRVPIGAGQMMHGLGWFREALSRGALDWVQPNAAFCGGITGLVRVLALAEAHGLPVAHAGGWDIANAAALAGHGAGGWLEMHGAQVSLRAMLAEDLVAEGGAMRLPERPGIGFAFR